MSSIRLAMGILLAVTVSSAHADPIATFHATQATMHMVPNDGSGDNVSFVFTGPGVEITGIGGMGCFDWCLSQRQPIPVDTPISTSQIFLSNLINLTLGGVSFEPFINFDGDTFFDDFGGLNPMVTFFPGDAIPPVTLFLPTGGGWSLNFEPTTDLDGNPALFFVDGTFSASAPPPSTPEPGTIVLMLTGSAGLAWGRRRSDSANRGAALQ